MTPRGTFGIEKRERMIQPDLVSHLYGGSKLFVSPERALQSPRGATKSSNQPLCDLRLRKLACHGAHRGEKCSSCSLSARASREIRARSTRESRERTSIGTVDAFGVRL